MLQRDRGLRVTAVLRMSCLVLVVLVAGCGSSGPSRKATRTTSRGPVTSTPLIASSGGASEVPGATASLPRPEALVTDEAQNRVLVVELPSGHVVRRISLPPDPEDIAASRNDGVVLVVSTSSGKVIVLKRSTLRRLRTFGGFDQPHIVAISPDGQYAYVTDDASGTLTAISLADLKLTRTLSVGAGAHHLSFSPNEREVWVALGESARTITVLSTADLARPRVVGHLVPGVPVHDLSFSPDGRRVWITSASGSDVTVFSASSRRVLFRVPVGPGPQHLAFAGAYVYATSGYGGVIDRIDASTGRIVDRAASPYGSFELSVADGYVACVSLLRGTIAIYTPALKRLRVVHLAPATREVAISRP